MIKLIKIILHALKKKIYIHVKISEVNIIILAILLDEQLNVFVKSYLGLHLFAVIYSGFSLTNLVQFFQPIIGRFKHSCLKAICLLSRSYHVFILYSF